MKAPLFKLTAAFISGWNMPPTRKILWKEKTDFQTAETIRSEQRNEVCSFCLEKKKKAKTFIKYFIWNPGDQLMRVPFHRSGEISRLVFRVFI